MALICTSKPFIEGVLRGFIKHKSINVTRSVRIISMMATSFSFSGTTIGPNGIGHSATKKFLATAGIANQ